MDYRILGPLEVRRPGGTQVELGGPKQRALLAALLLHRNTVVASDRLVDELWGEAAPATVRSCLHTHVLRLRRRLQAAQDPGEPPVLLTRSGGYLLRAAPGELDLDRFDRLVDDAQRAARDGAFEQAADWLHAALDLWRGPALANLPLESAQRVEAPRLEERRLLVLEECVETELRLGRHAGLIPELQAQVRAHPLRERPSAQLMLALYRSGRQAEALQVYQRTRDLLVGELGLEPGRELERLQRAILTFDTSLDWRPPGGAAAGDRPPAPCQLPPDIADFTGRHELVARVRELLAAERGERSTAVLVSAVAGKGGVGKTALAIRVAHQLRPRFPDGQLHADLRGTAPSPADPAEVLAAFLRALGVDGSAIPERIEERVARYRAQLADRCVLVVLDNAASVAQVRPLLPGSSTCAVLVTSRPPLAGLEGAHALTLQVLEPDDAVALLGTIAGHDRVAAELGAAHEIARLCGRLPLALRIAGAKLSARRDWRLARLAERLRDEQRRLDELRIADLEVRASIGLSYRGIPADARRAFRLLALLSAAEFAPWTLAALADVTVVAAEDTIERLVDAQLLEPAGRDRYRFHELVRIFARERARDEDAEQERDAALERALGACLSLAVRADSGLEFGGLCDPDDPRLRRYLPRDPAIVAKVAGDPLAWLNAERESLIAAIAQAHDAGLWQIAWRLADALAGFFELRADWDAWGQAHALALDAAQQAGDRHAQASVQRGFGALYRDQCRWDQAIACLTQCLPVLHRVGDRRGEANALLNLGNVHRGRCQLNEAIACLTRSLRTFRELGDRRGEANALQGLGNVYVNQGRNELALRHMRQALEIFQDRGDRHFGAYTLRELGFLYLKQGRPQEAMDCLERCLPVFRATGDRLWEAHTLLSMGEVDLDRQRWSEARTSLGRCLPMLRELGDRRGEAMAVRGLGRVNRALGRFDEAVECYERSCAISRELANRVAESYSLQGLGEVYHAQGRVEEAVACFERSLPALHDLGFRLDEGTTLSRLGELLADLGDHAAARGAARRAEAILRELDSPVAERTGRGG